MELADIYSGTDIEKRFHEEFRTKMNTSSSKLSTPPTQSKHQQSNKSNSQNSSSSSTSSRDTKSNFKSPRSASADASNKSKNSNRLKKAEKKPNYNKLGMLSSEEADDEEVMDTSSQDFTKTIWGDPIVVDSRKTSDGRERSCSPKEHRQNKFSPIRAPRK